MNGLNDLNSGGVSDTSKQDQLKDAGYFRRIAAFAIDHIILFLIILFLLLWFFKYFSVLKLFNSWAFSSFICIIIFFYQLVLMISESLWAGKTPGKYFVNITVKNDEGNDPVFLQLLVRNFFRCTYFIPPLFIIPDLVCYLAYGKRLGDLAAGTRVMKLK